MRGEENCEKALPALNEEWTARGEGNCKKTLPALNEEWTVRGEEKCAGSEKAMPALQSLLSLLKKLCLH